MPENEFLELCRDVDRMESQYAFKEAGIDALQRFSLALNRKGG